MNVLKDGSMDNVDVQELMVGDVVQVETGEIMSVDGIIFSANRVGMDESSVTGESNLVKKEDMRVGKEEIVLGAPPHSEHREYENPFLISGSKVMEGTGMMIVLAVGKNSREGINKMKLQEDSDTTPLQ